MKKYQAITVWAGAAASISPIYNEPMRKVGELLAENKIKMIYGIGDAGMMGCAFQGVRNKNGKVIGITTDKLLDLQCHDKSLFGKREVMVVDNLAVRKAKMMQLGEAILVGPGGWGTIDEISDFAVSIQIREIEKKPLIFLNFNHFWDPIREMIFRMLQDGTLNQDKVDYIEFVDSPEDIFNKLEEVENRLAAEKKVGKK